MVSSNAKNSRPTIVAEASLSKGEGLDHCFTLLINTYLPESESYEKTKAKPKKTGGKEFYHRRN